MNYEETEERELSNVITDTLQGQYRGDIREKISQPDLYKLGHHPIIMFVSLVCWKEMTQKHQEF